MVSAEKFRKRIPALLRTLHEAKLTSAELLLYKDEPTTRPPEIYKTPPYKWLAHCLYAGVHAPGQKEAPKKIVPWLPICNPSALKWRPLPELYRCFSYAAFNGLTHLAAVSEILVS